MTYNESGNWFRRSQKAPGDGTVGVDSRLLLGLAKKLLLKLLGFLLEKAGLDSSRKLRSNDGEKRLGEIGGSAAGIGVRIPGN